MSQSGESGEHIDTEMVCTEMRLVYLSPVPWNSVAQRPHFFVKAALRSGFSSVMWVEPTPSRLPKLKDFRTKLFSIEADSFNKPEAVEILKLRCLPIEPFSTVYDLVNRKTILGALKRIQEYCLGDEETILVIGKPSRFALKAMPCANFRKIIFDVMDDFPQFFQGRSARRMEEAHRGIIQSADMCLFSSHNLQKKYSYLAKQSELVLNACDKEFLAKCQSLSHRRETKASDIRIFGYVGSIAEWFDWVSIIKLAKDNPKDRVVIVGPNYSRNTPVLPENVELKKAVKHGELPKLLASFNFGLIPFIQNELTNSVDPVKYYEYVAAGLSIITTEFGEMKLRVVSGKAVSFSQFKKGITSDLDISVTWEERFNHIFKALLHVEKF